MALANKAWGKGLDRCPDWGVALGVYGLACAVYFVFAAPQVVSEHTPYNHFALLAEGWLHGRLDLAGGPPGYAHNNDFVLFEGRHFVAFPPFPAVLLLPWVALAGSAEAVRDGQIFLWLAGVAPATLFLALQALARAGHGARSRRANLVLSLCFAFGSVYFFTAEQGTVWFAAHVVGAALAAAYLWASVDARRPWLAGAALGLGVLTRTPLLYGAPLFVLEAWRTHHSAAAVPSGGGVVKGLSLTLASLDKGSFARALAAFGLPLAGCIALTLWHNYARFGDPFEPGYQYLTVAWKARMQKWGLFHYHYLPRNLGVVLTSLPWVGEKGVPFRINAHGLALWFTTPLYLWLLWPKHFSTLQRNLWITVGCVALPGLLYQNSGWAQFGYRFSNDYAPFLFALLALGMRPMRALFATAALWGVVVNGFGALSFGRQAFKPYYYYQGSQERLYQKD